MGAQIALPGTATPADILSGQTASSGAGFNFTGTMPAQGSPTFTPTPSPIAIPAGNYTGGTVAAAVLGASGTATAVTGTPPTVSVSGLAFTPSIVTVTLMSTQTLYNSANDATQAYTTDVLQTATLTTSTGAFTVASDAWAAGTVYYWTAVS